MRALLLLLLLALAGCPSTTSAPDDVAQTSGADVTVAEDAQVHHDAVAPEPEADPGRQVHRMTVRQLARSIPVITGGIAWIEDFGAGPLDMLEILYPTLGGPDYLLVTEENLEPSLIIAKFVQDAAYRICATWVSRDKGRAPEDRTLTVHEDWSSMEDADVVESLVALQLRFFARKIDLDDPTDAAAMADLSALFHAAAEGTSADAGWTAVCLAHMTAPEMVLY